MLTETKSQMRKRFGSAKVALRCAVVFCLFSLGWGTVWQVAAVRSSLTPGLPTFIRCIQTPCGPNQHCNMVTRWCENDTEPAKSGSGPGVTVCPSTKYGKYTLGKDTRCHWCPPRATWSDSDSKCQCVSGYELCKAKIGGKEVEDDRCCLIKIKKSGAGKL